MKTDERRTDEESKKENKQETRDRADMINIVAAAKSEQRPFISVQFRDLHG